MLRAFVTLPEDQVQFLDIHVGSQCSVTLAPWVLMPSSALQGHQEHRWHTDILADKPTPTLKIRIKYVVFEKDNPPRDSPRGKPDLEKSLVEPLPR